MGGGSYLLPDTYYCNRFICDSCFELTAPIDAHNNAKKRQREYGYQMRVRQQGQGFSEAMRMRMNAILALRRLAIFYFQFHPLIEKKLVPFLDFWLIGHGNARNAFIKISLVIVNHSIHTT